MGWGSFTTSWASSMTAGYSGPYVAGQTQTAFGVLPSFSMPTISPTAPAAGAAPTISLNQPVAEYGRVIPISMGTRRLPPQLIWAKPIYGDTTAGFFADFAVAWGFNGDTVPGDTDIMVLWANGIKIWDNGTKIMPGAWSVTLYKGTSTQTANASIVAAGGAATGYRGVLYGVFSAFPIGSDFNYSIPGISAEVVGSLGSTDAVTIEELINAVGDLAGLDSGSDIAVDASIDDIVDGAVIATETTFDDFTQNLGKWFGFDRFEGGSTINFIQPVDGATYTVDATIPASAILNDSEKGIATTRGEDDSPILLSGAYIDQTQQFRYSTQRARRILFPVPSTRSTRETSLAVPIVMTANEAISYLGQAIYRMAQQNVVHTFKLPPRYMYIEPGDILSITAATVVYTVKVTKVEIGPELSISVAAVNLYTDEIISLEGDSGNPLPGYEGEPDPLPAAPLDDLSPTAAYSASRNLISAYGGARYTDAGGGVISAFLDQSGNTRNLTQATAGNRPSLATAGPNSRECIDFDGTNDILTGAAISNFFTNSAGYAVMSFQIDTLTSTNVSYTGVEAWGDTGGYLGVVMWDDGSASGIKRASAYNYDGSQDYVGMTVDNLDVDTPNVLEWRHEGGTLYLRVNGVAEYSIASGNTSSMAGALRMAAGDFNYFNAKIYEFVTFDTVPILGDRDALVDNLMAWCGAT